MAVALSPESEISVYFDAPVAPIAPFIMSSPPHPLVSTAMPAANHNTSNDPYVTGTDSAIHRPQSSSGWLPAVDAPNETNEIARKGSVSKHSTTQDGNSTNLRRSTSRRSLFTNPDGQPIEGSMFMSGAATSGPHSIAQPHEEVSSRTAAANASLTSKQRSRIAKSEAVDTKRISKIIMGEGRTEKQALNIAIKELADLQKLQAATIKSQETAHAARNKILVELKKREALFLAARTSYEAAQAHLASQDEAIQSEKDSAIITTERLEEKSREVDSLRKMYGVDERERAARLAAMAGKPESHCVIA